MEQSRIKRYFCKMDEKIESISPKWEFVFILVFSAMMVLGVINVMGTITSGFHLVDDHEFAEWMYFIKHQGYDRWDYLRHWVLRDFGMRYEPAYYTMRMLGTYLFGIDLIPYSIIKALQIIIAFNFLYYCGRMMGAKKVYAFLFAAISLVGYQSAVWWKLGPQESQCTMFFSIGFFCMLKWLKQNKKIWGIASICAFFIMCNYKESFILLVPFIVCYVIYDTIEAHAGKTEISEQNFFGRCKDGVKQTLRNLEGRYWYMAIMSLIFIVLIGIIVFYVGVNNYGGAGLNPDATLDIYKESFWRSMNSDLKWYKRFGIVFIAILLTLWEDFKKLWKEVFLTILFLLPQFVIFAQTGIAERYILPGAIGFAFFFVIIMSKWKPLANKRRFVYGAGVVLLLLASTRAMLIEADYFRYRGEGVTNMLETVRELSDEDTKTLSCLNDEGNLTIKFWSYLHGLDEDNIFYWHEWDKSINKGTYENEMNGYAKTDLSIEDMDIIIMYTKRDRHFTHFPTIPPEGFIKVDSGTLEIWIRNP